MIWQRLRCKHDVNGNPRRLWVKYNMSGNVMEIINEGYGGSPIPDHTSEVRLVDIEITPNEYRRWISMAKRFDLLVEG